MSNIPRWRIEDSCGYQIPAERSDDGPWVRWEDAEALYATVRQYQAIPELPAIGREVELRMALQRFMDFQISDYDRLATRAHDYCEIRRDARKLLQRYADNQFPNLKDQP